MLDQHQTQGPGHEPHIAPTLAGLGPGLHAVPGSVGPVHTLPVAPITADLGPMLHTVPTPASLEHLPHAVPISAGLGPTLHAMPKQGWSGMHVVYGAYSGYSGTCYMRCPLQLIQCLRSIQCLFQLVWDPCCTQCLPWPVQDLCMHQASCGRCHLSQIG